MKRQLLFIAMLMVVLLAGMGCAGQRTLKTSQGIRIFWDLQDRLGPGYFALLENTPSGWRVVELSETPIVGRRNSDQDVLYLNQSLSQLQPYFERMRTSTGWSFECTTLANDSSKYDACNSNLMTTNIVASIGKSVVSLPTTLGLGAGTHRQISEKKIDVLLAESGLLDRIEEFRRDKVARAAEEQRLREERSQREAAERERIATEKRRIETERQARKVRAETFAGRIAVVPIVRDHSGYYDGQSRLVAFTVDWNRDFPGELEHLSYSVTLNPAGDEYRISMDPSRYEVKFEPTDKGISLQPVVEVKARRFYSFHPGFRVKSRDGLLVSIKEIAPRRDGKIEMAVVLSNESDKYITIEALSTYLDTSVNTQMEEKFEIPPGATSSRTLAVLFPTRADLFEGLCDLQTGYVSVACADKYKVSIGAAAKYQVGNKRETLVMEGGSPSIEYRLDELVR